MNLNPTNLFASGSIIFLSLGLLSQLFFGDASVDIQLHNTYFIVAYVHLFYTVALILGFFAIIYFLYSKFFRRRLNRTMGNIHFWATVLTLPIICFLVINYWIFRDKMNWDVSIMITAFVAFFQLLFVFNLIYSFWKGEKVQK